MSHTCPLRPAEVRAARSEAPTVLPLPPANVQDLHEALRSFEGVALALDAAHMPFAGLQYVEPRVGAAGKVRGTRAGASEMLAGIEAGGDTGR